MAKGFGSSIERWGVADVMDGFDLAVNDGALYYTVWNGGTRKYTYDGDDIGGIGRDIFNQMITAAHAGGSSAQYTICFYKRLDKNDEISDNTSYVSSCNFKLIDKAQILPYNPGMAGMGATSEVMTAIAGLNKRLDEMEAADIEPENPTHAFVRDIVNSPAGNTIMNGLAGFLSKFIMPTPQPPTQRHGMSGTGDEHQGEEPSQKDLAVQAVNRLMKVDDQLGTHLQKLAHLAETNPDKYQWALNFL